MVHQLFTFPVPLPVSRRVALGIFGAAGVAAALSACSAPEGSRDGASGAGEPKWDAEAQQYVLEADVAQGKRPLTVWVEYEEYGKALKDSFEKAYSGAVLNYEVVAKVDALEKMALDGEAGKGPDVFMINFDDLAQAVSSSLAAPMGQYKDIIEQRCGEHFTSVLERDDQLYGVPVSTESIALFYNKTLLRQLTGKDTPAETWDEIIELAHKYNDKAANRWTIRFLAGEMYYAYPVLSSAGWHMYPDGNLDKPGFTEATMKTGLDEYRKIRSIWDVNAADATYDYIENEFIKGETPYVITGPWVFGDFDAAAKENGFEYGVTKLPKLSNGGPAASLAGLGVAVVSGYSTAPAGSRVLAAFMSSEAGAAALYQSIKAIPALAEGGLAGVAGLSDDEHAAGILAQTQQADFVREIPEYMYTAGNELVAAVWDGVKDVESAQADAEKSYVHLKDLAS